MDKTFPMGESVKRVDMSNLCFFICLISYHPQARPSTRPARSLSKAPNGRRPKNFGKKEVLEKKNLVLDLTQKQICTILLIKEQDQNSLV